MILRVPWKWPMLYSVITGVSSYSVPGRQFINRVCLETIPISKGFVTVIRLCCYTYSTIKSRGVGLHCNCLADCTNHCYLGSHRCRMFYNVLQELKHSNKCIMMYWWIFHGESPILNKPQDFESHTMNTIQCSGCNWLHEADQTAVLKIVN